MKNKAYIFKPDASHPDVIEAAGFLTEQVMNKKTHGDVVQICVFIMALAGSVSIEALPKEEQPFAKNFKGLMELTDWMAEIGKRIIVAKNRHNIAVLCLLLHFLEVLARRAK